MKELLTKAKLKEGYTDYVTNLGHEELVVTIDGNDLEAHASKVLQKIIKDRL